MALPLPMNFMYIISNIINVTDDDITINFILIK